MTVLNRMSKNQPFLEIKKQKTTIFWAEYFVRD